MVNRPGRSKGCITCRRRKVKCDESRPLCTRCAKSGNTCEGYQDSRAFVWVGTEPFDLGQTSESSGHPSSSTTIAATSSPETLSVQPTAAAQQDVFFANVDPILLQDFIHPVLSIKLDHHAFRASIYQTHLFQHLLGHTETGGKGAHLAPISYPTDLNRASVNALSMTFFGRMHHLPEVSHQGDLLYSKAILQLAGKLNGGDEAFSTHVLMATLTLTVHEIVNSVAYNGWIQHAGGIGRLIEARGPWRHQLPQERILFESSRPMIVAKALYDKKRTFLEQTSWQTIPWAADPNGKTQQSRIFDIISLIPGLFEDLANFETAAVAAETTDPSLNPGSALHVNEQKQSLQTNIDTSLTTVNQWYQNWSTIYPDAVQTISSPRQFGSSNIPYPVHLFGMPLLFPSLLRANEYILYNTAIFLLLTIASQVSSSAPASPFDQIRPVEGEHLSVPVMAASVPSIISRYRQHVATETCKTIPYFLQFDLHAYSGAYLLCFPLNILLGIYGMSTEKGQFVAHVLTDIASNWSVMAGDAWLRHIKEKEARGGGLTQESVSDGW